MITSLQALLSSRVSSTIQQTFIYFHFKLLLIIILLNLHVILFVKWLLLLLFYAHNNVSNRKHRKRINCYCGNKWNEMKRFHLPQKEILAGNNVLFMGSGTQDWKATPERSCDGSVAKNPESQSIGSRFKSTCRGSSALAHDTLSPLPIQIVPPPQKKKKKKNNNNNTRTFSINNFRNCELTWICFRIIKI